jgi:tetratricopeptide (TPR) repeat protein
LDRLTRHELKQDQFRDNVERIEHFARKNWRQLTAGAAAVAVILGLVMGLKTYSSRQEAAANVVLGAALKTFNAYVGTVQPGTLSPGDQTFPTAQAKYQKALGEFLAVVAKYPHTDAAAYARIHAAICDAQLGKDAEAIKILNPPAHSSNREIASLAQFALANEYAKTNKTADAEKIYQDLSQHPTLAVPRATALMAMAQMYSAQQPARARQIYAQLQKEYASDQTLADAIKQQLAALPN